MDFQLSDISLFPSFPGSIFRRQHWTYSIYGGSNITRYSWGQARSLCLSRSSDLLIKENWPFEFNDIQSIVRIFIPRVDGNLRVWSRNCSQHPSLCTAWRFSKDYPADDGAVTDVHPLNSDNAHIVLCIQG